MDTVDTEISWDVWVQCQAIRAPNQGGRYGTIVGYLPNMLMALTSILCQCSMAVKRHHGMAALIKGSI